MQKCHLHMFYGTTHVGIGASSRMIPEGLTVRRELKEMGSYQRNATWQPWHATQTAQENTIRKTGAGSN